MEVKVAIITAEVIGIDGVMTGVASSGGISGAEEKIERVMRVTTVVFDSRW